ncbi:unnamed protein product [Heterobilharzia americana]|nr:unnamed protein product [Heterobilharzia americana]
MNLHNNDNLITNQTNVFFPSPITDWSQSHLFIPSETAYSSVNINDNNNNNNNNDNSNTNNQFMHANSADNINPYEHSFLQMMNKQQF